MFFKSSRRDYVCIGMKTYVWLVVYVVQVLLHGRVGVDMFVGMNV